MLSLLFLLSFFPISYEENDIQVSACKGLGTSSQNQLIITKKYLYFNIESRIYFCNCSVAAKRNRSVTSKIMQILRIVRFPLIPIRSCTVSPPGY